MKAEFMNLFIDFIACCNALGEPSAKMAGKSRKAEIVQPRHVIAYYLTSELGYGLSSVGRVLGGRDHSSVVHSRNVVRGVLSLPVFCKEKNQIAAKLAALEKKFQFKNEIN